MQIKFIYILISYVQESFQPYLNFFVQVYTNPLQFFTFSKGFKEKISIKIHPPFLKQKTPVIIKQGEILLFI
ncbi:hypothetical protein bcgnr5378_32730 [Bacillus cereus]